MPSVNKTPTLGLNQWEGNEYFKREDLVSDNELIDAAIKQDRAALEQKADKESPRFTGTPTINGNEIATVNNIPSGLSLGETSSTAYQGDRGKVAYDHSQSAHAPSTAQKNSDITKAEIEAKLIGEISTHYHASDSTKAPNNHASPSDLYGLSTSDYYGHTRVWNGLDATSASGAIALHANQGKILNDKINNIVTRDSYGKTVVGTQIQTFTDISWYHQQVSQGDYNKWVKIGQITINPQSDEHCFFYFETNAVNTDGNTVGAWGKIGLQDANGKWYFQSDTYSGTKAYISNLISTYGQTSLVLDVYMYYTMYYTFTATISNMKLYSAKKGAWQ